MTTAPSNASSNLPSQPPAVDLATCRSVWRPCRWACLQSDADALTGSR